MPVVPQTHKLPLLGLSHRNQWSANRPHLRVDWKAWCPAGQTYKPSKWSSRYLSMWEDGCLGFGKSRTNPFQLACLDWNQGWTTQLEMLQDLSPKQCILRKQERPHTISCWYFWAGNDEHLSLPLDRQSLCKMFSEWRSCIVWSWLGILSSNIGYMSVYTHYVELSLQPHQQFGVIVIEFYSLL